MAHFRDYTSFVVAFGSLPTFEGSGVEPVLLDQDSEKKALLDLIFTVDPVTGLPSGDIGQVLGKNLSPEVVQFIKDNLMQDFSQLAAKGVPAGIDDGEVLELSRSDGESRSDYIQRVRKYYDTYKDTIAKQQELLRRAQVEPPKTD